MSGKLLQDHTRMVCYITKKFLRYLNLIIKKASEQDRVASIDTLIENGTLSIGVGTYQYHLLNINQYRGSEAKVIIGKYCSIARDVRIITGGIHPADWISTYPFRIKFKLPLAYKDGMPKTKGNIIIGNDVWIGTGAIILSGIRIENGAIISAGAVVTKDVPAYAVVGGVPASLIGYRFPPKVIEKLCSIKWWDWEEEEIIKNVPLLSSNRIDDFIELHWND